MNSLWNEIGNTCIKHPNCLIDKGKGIINYRVLVTELLTFCILFYLCDWFFKVDTVQLLFPLSTQGYRSSERLSNLLLVTQLVSGEVEIQILVCKTTESELWSPYHTAPDLLVPIRYGHKDPSSSQTQLIRKSVRISIRMINLSS